MLDVPSHHGRLCSPGFIADGKSVQLDHDAIHDAMLFHALEHDVLGLRVLPQGRVEDLLLSGFVNLETLL